MKFITTYVHNVYHQSVVLKLLGIFFHNRHISILFLKLPMSAVWNGPQNISSEMGGLNFLVLRLLKVLKRAFKINFQLSGESSSWKRELWLAKSHVFITVCMANIERFTPLYAIMNSVENLRNCFQGRLFSVRLFFGYFLYGRLFYKKKCVKTLVLRASVSTSISRSPKLRHGKCFLFLK